MAAKVLNLDEQVLRVKERIGICKLGLSLNRRRIMVFSRIYLSFAVLCSWAKDLHETFAFYIKPRLPRT